jgi:hypothetical protein
MTSMPVLQGGCHCGNLGVQFSSASSWASFTPRACDCSFCVKHGAAYISDPKGRLALDVNDSALLHEYRQGSESARFLLCRSCGVLVAVVYEEGASTYGAVNVKCLDERDRLGNEQVASPQRFGAEEKKSRWKALWTPDVEIALARIPRQHP